MSYIRSTSNPESVYIWANPKGQVEIMYRVKKPLGAGQSMVIPRHVFHSVCKAWSEGRTTISQRGLRVEDVFVNTETGKPVKMPKDPFLLLNVRHNEHFVKLSYQGKFFHMWMVTWEAIVHNVESRK